MERVKKFLVDKGVGYYLTLPALLFCIIALCLYVKNGVTSFSPELNADAIVWIVVSMAAAVVGLFLNFKFIRYIAYLTCLYSFMWFIHSQVTYIANVFVAIDGYTFTGGFVATVIFYVISFVSLLLAAILSNWQPWEKEKTTMEVIAG